jgi:hypothetical protein
MKCEGKNLFLDEATQEQTNNSLSTNDIIEDTQSTQGEIHERISQNHTGSRIILIRER